MIDENADWKICECELCVEDRISIIAWGVAEQILKNQDETTKEVLIFSAISSQVLDGCS